MLKNMATKPQSERPTILHNIAVSCEALEELGKRLSEIEARLYPPHPMPTTASEGGDNVESLIEAQRIMIQQHIETAVRIMIRLA